MFYLHPQDLVTDELVERLQAALAPSVGLKPAELQDVLTRIFSRMDNFPVFDRELDGAEKTALGARLLTDATTKLLTMSGYNHTQFGFVLESQSDGPVQLRVRSTDLVPINFASGGQLETLPGIGRKLAESIISERQEGGPFSSIKELVKRVDGLGPKTGDDLAHTLSFRFPESDFQVLAPERDLGQAIKLLVSLMPGENVVSRLMAALDQVAIALAADAPIGLPEMPHLARRDTDRDGFSSGAVETLVDSDYFTRVSELLDGAMSSIDVCMFHIALPSPDHPTRKLLDALLSAHARGVIVRVLLDRDRVNDPYQSTIINSPARDFLNQDAELCRFDHESVLLHSKYVIIDEEVVVVGSHNWSAGSFFNFDDLSMVVHSSDYAEHMAKRFTAQWNDAANIQ